MGFNCDGYVTSNPTTCNKTWDTVIGIIVAIVIVLIILGYIWCRQHRSELERQQNTIPHVLEYAHSDRLSEQTELSYIIIV